MRVALTETDGVFDFMVFGVDEGGMDGEAFGVGTGMPSRETLLKINVESTI